jgi:hypothetical protein
LYICKENLLTLTLEGNKMRMAEFPTLYVMEAGAELMDKIRREGNYWAEGDENICMTFEDALEIDELKELISGKNAGDVVISI